MADRTFARILALSVLLGACASTGRYVWVDDLPRADDAGARDYVIGSGDLLSVRVYAQDPVSTRVRVLGDGKITVPLVGDVIARGRRPSELAKEIETKLKPFLVAPSVSVTVEEAKPMSVSVVGEVAHPGVYVLEPMAGVLTAVASAGGTTEFADRDRIFVLRRASGGGEPLRIRFRWEHLVHAEGRALGFALQPGDVVVVE